MTVFVDASVLVAIVRTSAVAIWEASVGIARIFALEPRAALILLRRFLQETEIALEPIDGRVAAGAVEAFGRFGKGRHPAGLNMGDCFAYAGAKALECTLLCKGEDFARTDLASHI